MPLRFLVRFVFGKLNNEEMIQRLSESYAIKRAAQLTSMWIHRGRNAIEDARESSLVEEIKQTGLRAERIRKTMARELKTDLADLKDVFKLKPFSRYKK